MPKPFKLLLATFFFLPVTGLAAAQESFECLIAPWEVVKLGARSTGVLDQLSVSRGDRVEVGQEVAVLNSEIEAASMRLLQERAQSTVQIELAEARLDYERATVERNRQLFDRKIVSSQELDAAEASFRIAELQVAEARTQQRLSELEFIRAQAIFDLRTILSPVEGVVLSTDRTVGEYLTENDHVATIATINPLQAEAFLPLDMIDRLAVGDPAIVSPQEPVGGEYMGRIDVVDPVVEARSGTIGIRIRIENPEKLTISGLRCTVRFP